MIWHSPNPERWGAFAGGFEEVDENVEYEEKEDEFDIVRVVGIIIVFLGLTLQQEDEEVILKRKMKEEDQRVDIDTLAEDSTHRNTLPDGMDVEDEDLAWAAIDAEDPGEFRVKIIMQPEDDSEM